MSLISLLSQLKSTFSYIHSKAVLDFKEYKVLTYYIFNGILSIN